MPKVVRPIVGIDRIYYAKLLTNTLESATYETPKRLVGAKEFSFVPSVKSASYYEDAELNTEYNQLDYIELTINVTDVLAEDMVDIFGHIKAKNGGYMITNADISSEIAILVRMRLAGGQYRYMVFYKGQMTVGEGQVKNGDDKLEFSTKTLTGKFTSLNKNGLNHYVVDSDDTNAPETLDTDFFKSVIVAEPHTEEL